MPRITPIRVTFLLLGCIVSLIILWFTLPFPQIRNADQYYRAVLQSGHRLTTVHSQGWTFSSPGPIIQGDDEAKSIGTYDGVVFYWQLIQSAVRGNITLQVGLPRDTAGDLGCEVDLVSTVVDGPRFVQEMCCIRTPAGDQDGLSLPYFDYADATLLYHESFNTWQDTCLQMLIPEAGILQIGKYLPEWNDYNASDPATIKQYQRRYLIATFDLSLALRNVQGAGSEDIDVSFQDAFLPTRTYAVRRLILAVLAPLYFSTTLITNKVLYPTLLVIAFGFESIVCIFLGVWLIALACWLASGRSRPFASWTKDFWLTKRIARNLFGAPRPRIWGTLGPLDGVETDEDKYATRPRPLTSIFDFFQSTSPLDDLLVTFKATRWMVQPIGQHSAYQETTSPGYSSARSKTGLHDVKGPTS
ncbi:hypothetical protein OHC33_003265 [Knufia fluminis]|uniref:Uncharacterized protein n=1 Tax=Knufia fluminis TaxID=191047 RepID=A0AAN8I7A9_9EURO|nr:hypothetical protein OHC33_003265 [Knufia fluminis]